MFCWNLPGKAQTITTFAGIGYGGYSGDGGAATAARFREPMGLSIDTAGNIYIADMDNSVIRKVDASGIIYTIAGTGTSGYSGDGGAATSARLNHPASVAIDIVGNIFISELDNHCIRKVSTSGIISTIAGTGSAGYSGDGGPATAATLNEPRQIAITNSGYLYIADLANNRVRVISPSGIINTFAGTGTYGYAGDGGPATAALLAEPYGVAVDGSGNVYISDQSNWRIRVVNISLIISNFAGNGTVGYGGDGGPATAAVLGGAGCIKVDVCGDVCIADVGNNLIRKVNTAGIITTIAGMVTAGSGGYGGDGGAATAARLSTPYDMQYDARGNLYIADMINERIRKVSGCGPVIGAIMGPDRVCVGDTVTLTDTTVGGVWSSGTLAVATVNSSGVVSCFSAGTAVISYTVSNGCGCAYVTKLITILPALVVGVIAGPDSVCAGNTVTLTDTASGGIWSSGTVGVATVTSSGVVSGVSAGTAVISYVVTNSCGTAYTTKLIHVLPAPAAGAITGKDSVCVGATVTMVDTTTSGAWSSSNTSLATVSAGVVTGVAPGTLNIRYIVNNSCGSDTATHPVTVLSYAFCHAGVEAGQERQSGISISPNPVRASLNIVAEIPLRAVIITVDGRKVLDEQNAKTINLSSFINGMYMLLLFDKDGVMVRNEKVVKE